MQFNNQQAITFLGKLHEAGVKSAIIAGGAVRDEIFGKPVKDIDFFVSSEDFVDVKKIQENLGKKVTRLTCTGYASIPDVGSVYDIEWKTGELPMQIIVMEDGMTPEQRINTFDFGFCQVGYNGKEIIASEHFTTDYESRTISLVYCENQHEHTRSMARYDRLSQKYPEFTLVAKGLSDYPIRKSSNDDIDSLLEDFLKNV